MGCNRSDIPTIFIGTPMPATKEQLTQGQDLCTRFFHAGLSSGDIIADEDGVHYWLNPQLLQEEKDKLGEKIGKLQARFDEMAIHQACLQAKFPTSA